MDAGQRWYVVHTRAHYEEIAWRNLSQQGFTAYLPRYEKRRRHARRVDWVRAPLFPRYLFVRVNLEEVGLSALNWMPGVESLVSFGGLPAVVPGGAIEVIRDRLARKPVQRGVNWAHGQRVRFREGPLQGLEAVFDRSLGPSGRVRVLMACMRQGWPAEVDDASLERVGEVNDGWVRIAPEKGWVLLAYHNVEVR